MNIRAVASADFKIFGTHFASKRSTTNELGCITCLSLGRELWRTSNVKTSWPAYLLLGQSQSASLSLLPWHQLGTQWLHTPSSLDAEARTGSRMTVPLSCSARAHLS